MMIHYVAQYSFYRDRRNLEFSPAGLNKMNYIIEKLKQTNLPIKVYSTCNTKSKKLFLARNIRVDKNLTISYQFTFGTSIKILKKIQFILRKIQLFIYLLFVVKSKDIVIFYHERFYTQIIILIKKLKRFKVIIEIEEIYSTVPNLSMKAIEYEINSLDIADGYIFSNDFLPNVILSKKKPYIVSYGPYNTIPFYNHPSDDMKIHLVYAGNLSIEKGGAFAAIEAANYLNEKYCLHIIGFGTQAQIELIKEKIKKYKCFLKASVTFEGLFVDKDYFGFLQKCHIGLCTRNLNRNFVNYSFPSKILSYMGNNLRVVAPRFKAIEMSEIHNHVFYYNKQDPLAIANTIKEINLNASYDGRKIVRELDQKFSKKFIDLIFFFINA